MIEMRKLIILCPDLPSRLYPTVGLQTPGEIIDANFGQEPFKFDIEGEMRELRRKTQGLVEELNDARARRALRAHARGGRVDGAHAGKPVGAVVHDRAPHE